MKNKLNCHQNLDPLPCVKNAYLAPTYKSTFYCTVVLTTHGNILLFPANLCNPKRLPVSMPLPSDWGGLCRIRTFRVHKASFHSQQRNGRYSISEGIIQYVYRNIYFYEIFPLCFLAQWQKIYSI